MHISYLKFTESSARMLRSSCNQPPLTRYPSQMTYPFNFLSPSDIQTRIHPTGFWIKHQITLSFAELNYFYFSRALICEPTQGFRSGIKTKWIRFSSEASIFNFFKASLVEGYLRWITGTLLHLIVFTHLKNIVS